VNFCAQVWVAAIASDRINYFEFLCYVVLVITIASNSPVSNVEVSQRQDYGCSTQNFYHDYQ